MERKYYMVWFAPAYGTERKEYLCSVDRFGVWQMKGGSYMEAPKKEDISREVFPPLFNMEPPRATYSPLDVFLTVLKWVMFGGLAVLAAGVALVIFLHVLDVVACNVDGWQSLGCKSIAWEMARDAKG